MITYTNSRDYTDVSKFVLGPSKHTDKRVSLKRRWSSDSWTLQIAFHAGSEAVLGGFQFCLSSIVSRLGEIVSVKLFYCPLKGFQAFYVRP